MNVQSLVLNAFLTPEEVGVYAAYNTATIGISGYLAYAVGTVLFPKASASTNRQRLWDLGARTWKYLAPAAVLFFIAVEAGHTVADGQAPVRHGYAPDAAFRLLRHADAGLQLTGADHILRGDKRPPGWP